MAAWREALVLPVLRGDPPRDWALLTFTLKERGILFLVINTNYPIPAMVILKQEAAG